MISAVGALKMRSVAVRKLNSVTARDPHFAHRLHSFNLSCIPTSRCTSPEKLRFGVRVDPGRVVPAPFGCQLVQRQTPYISPHYTHYNSGGHTCCGDSRGLATAAWVAGPCPLNACGGVPGGASEGVEWRRDPGIGFALIMTDNNTSHSQ